MRNPLRVSLLWRVVPVLGGLALLAGLGLRADTVFLKDGSQILDCKILSESEASVSVRTPSGDMVVPRSQVFRIQKVKTVYDRFEEQRSRLAANDVAGFFKLAQWCRGTDGLRQEGDELLLKILELKPDHAATRRLLGHVQVDGKWVVPAPLEIELKTSTGTAADRKALREQFALFLRSRRDVRLLPEGTAADPRLGCVTSLAVTLSQGGAPTFYGKKLGAPQLGASVLLQSRSSWIGKSPLKTSVSGQVPSGVANAASQGIKNALGSGGQTLHKYLDQLLQLRAQALVKELGQKEKAAGARKAAQPSKA